MKKASIIALLVVFLFNTAGYYIVFVAQKMQIKKEIRAQINAGYMNESLTEILTFKKSELHTVLFMDEGQEIKYNDKMYDIVKSTETEETISYYCIDDSKENFLFSELGKHIDSHVSSTKPLKGKSHKFQENVIKVYFSTENETHLKRSETTVKFTSVCMTCLSAQKQTETPPPPEFC